MKTRTIKYACFALAAILFFNINAEAQAQSSSSKVLDGIYIKHRTATRRVIPFAHIREADVMWQKRIWRVLDMRQKMNYPLYYPITEIQGRKDLYQVVQMGVKEGTITAYGNPVYDDEFTVPLTIAEAEKTMSYYQSIYRQDTATGQMISDSALTKVTAQDVMRWWMKEDWVFDKQRSVMDVRIIGLAPLKQKLNDDGSIRGYTPLFWVYFPECRYVFANYEVYNFHNDAERLSYNDVFQDRIFSSYIRKKSNVYDRYLINFNSPFEVLLKSQQITNNMQNFEHDLWHF